MKNLDLFWTTLSLQDSFIGLVFLCLVIPAVFSSRIDRFFPKMLDAFIYNRDELFFDRIGKHVSPRSFSFWGRVHQFLLLSLNLFLVLKEAFLSMPIYLSVIYFVGIFVSLSIFFLARRSVYRLLGVLYLPTLTNQSWKRKYCLLEWIWSIPLYVSACLMLIPLSFEIGILVFAVAFALWRIILISKTSILLLREKIDYLLIFLYLCGQEIAPFLFLYGVVAKLDWV